MGSGINPDLLHMKTSHNLINDTPERALSPSYGNLLPAVKGFGLLGSGIVVGPLYWVILICILHSMHPIMWPLHITWTEYNISAACFSCIYYSSGRVTQWSNTWRSGGPTQRWTPRAEETLTKKCFLPFNANMLDSTRTIHNTYQCQPLVNA